MSPPSQPPPLAPPSRLHLGYCTNVHPGGDLAALHRVVEVHGAAVRRRLGVERLGLGLWLGQAVVAALAGDRSGVARLGDAMAAAGVYPFTLNCFPYGNFQAGAVKRAVYTPDWTSPARADYTVAAARLLVELAPPEVATATLSTLPLGWGDGWDGAHTEVACARLVATAVALRRLADENGRGVRLCIEPEPGCVVETTAQAIDLFHGPLAAAARAAGEGRSLIDETLGLCFDCCHQAVAFESPEASLDALAAAGLVVGKAQLSCGLEVADPSAAATRAALVAFDEPRFLHQVRAGGPMGWWWRRTTSAPPSPGPRAVVSRWTGRGGSTSTRRSTARWWGRWRPPRQSWPAPSATWWRRASATTWRWRPTPGRSSRMGSDP